MKINRFEDFPIWKLSLKITKEIYDITQTSKFMKDFVLRDQIRRAVVSISSNIVEGFEKNNNNEFIRYLKIAKGSVGETRNQLIIAETINYISSEKAKTINLLLLKLAKQIGGFIVYLDKKRNKGEFKKK